MKPVAVGQNNARSYDGALMERGKEAENIVIEFLKKRPEVVGVSDWRQLRETREADVDVAIKTIDGRITLAEIKSDSYLGVSGNVLFEVLRINHTCQTDYALTLGWSGRTPAKYILFFAPNINKIYRFDTELFRKAFQKYTQKQRKHMQISIVETDAIKTTINVLIPISQCFGAYTVYDLE